MRRFIYLIIVIFALGMIRTAYQHHVDSSSEDSAPTGQDSLVVEPNEIEMNLDSESSLRQQLQLTNRGNQVIRIELVSATCGCTVIQKIENPEISPGGKLAIMISGSPPALGQKHAHITIETNSRSAKTIVIPVRLIGGSLNVPFISHHPKEVTVTKTHPTAIGNGEFSVQAIELIGTPFWLRRDQCDSNELRVWSESDPVEDKLSDQHVRRTYTFQVATAVPLSTIQANRYRFAVTTIEPHADPAVELTIVSRLVEQLRVVPCVLNVRNLRKSNVVVLDSRIGHEHDSIQSHVKYDWIRLVAAPVVVQKKQTIRTFEIVCSPGPDAFSTAELQVEIEFFSVTDANERVRLPICITRE